MPCHTNHKITFRHVPITGMLFIRYAVILFLLIVHPSDSYPTGAGGCDGNGPAVGGVHLQRNGERGSLSEAHVSLTVDDILVDDAGNITISAGTSHTFVLSGVINPFKGYLFRLESTSDVDTTGALLPVINDALSQVADVCVSPVVGVTHTSDDFKTEAAAIIDIDQEASFILDLTVVTLYDQQDGSDFYYSQFQVNVVTGNSVPTSGQVPSISPITVFSLDSLFPTLAETATNGFVIPSSFPSLDVEVSGSPVSQPLDSASAAPSMRVTEAPVASPALQAGNTFPSSLLSGTDTPASSPTEMPSLGNDPAREDTNFASKSPSAVVSSVVSRTPQRDMTTAPTTARPSDLTFLPTVEPTSRAYQSYVRYLFTKENISAILGVIFLLV
jgi:hypothetical protein